MTYIAIWASGSTLFAILLLILFATENVPKFKDSRVHSKNRAVRSERVNMVSSKKIAFTFKVN